MKRFLVLFTILTGCATPVDQPPRATSRIVAPVQSTAVSLNSPLEKARWVTFLMDELYALRRANEDGRHGDCEIALLLEIASYDSFALRMAAEAMEARIDTIWFWDRHFFEDLMCNVRLDREPRTDEDGHTYSGWPLMIKDGKLKIADDRRMSWSGPMFLPLTQYSGGRTIHELDVEEYGLRDLAPYSSQRLTDDQFDGLRAKYADWDGEVFVPDEPAEPFFQDRYDGLTWDLLGSVRSIENEHALSALLAANVGIAVNVSGGTTHISVFPDHIERARDIVRTDAKNNGYSFRE